jgi:hypothetical protein
MKKKEIILFISCCLVIVFTGCTNGKADVIYPAPSCDTTLVSHSKDLTPIMAANCFDCHSGSNPIGGWNLQDTTTLQMLVLNGTLISAIEQDGNASLMPQGKAKLTPCEINKFIAWGDQGAKGNN